MRQYRITGLNVKHKKFKEIEGLSGEVRFGDTVAECVTLAGGEANARDALNSSTVRAAKQAIRSRAANAPDDDTAEKFQEDVNKIFAEAVPSAGRIGPTTQSVKDFATKIREMQAAGQDVSGDLLMQLAKEQGIL